MNNPIVIGLSPNTTADDYRLAFSTLLSPQTWQHGEEIAKVETWFKNYFNTNHVFTFNAGRSALFAILKALKLERGSEVLMQAFTCVAVPNSLLWAGYKPVFVDIDKTQNLDVNDATKKISAKTKALIIQHTFGIPGDLEKIVPFCQKHQLYLIEDCAHALGATYHGKLVGKFGQAAFFSFGRDKIVSSVFGGVAITNSNQISKILSKIYTQVEFPSMFWTFRQLIHPLISFVSLAFYNFLGIGKGILYLSQKLGLISFPVSGQEYKSQQPKEFPKRLPNALARLALRQLEKLEQFNVKRREIAKLYTKSLGILKPPRVLPGAIYLRYNLLTKRADELMFQAKKADIILGNWYKNTIDPKGVDEKHVGYIRGSCPRAEKVAELSLNLPTYPRMTIADTRKVVNFITHYLSLI